MSRRPPNPGAEKAAQNQATIKNLLKLEPNKVCADCKRNKHPRWASWNLGVFVCIRCSGIHRGMGTHISRVKSVDLDSWTDEQLQSILSWGNARANKYWEAKLAAGHVPSEAKIENFIRTKYELKRWVMDGPMPDPSTLDAEGDDDVPLSLVKEKQTVGRKEAARKGSLGQSSSAGPVSAPAPVDLMGGDIGPPRAASAAPKSAPAPPRATPAGSSTKDSLLGLDFFGGEPSAPPRPSSAAAATSAAQSRPDLKQSILSLYATAPRPQQQPAQASPTFGGMASSPGLGQRSGGGLNDAFSSLSFGAPAAASPAPPRVDAFSGLGSISSPRAAPPASSSAFSNLGAGGFFDTKPAAAASSTAPTHQPQRSISGLGGGFGGFGSPVAAAPKPAAAVSSSFGDLFDLSDPAPAATIPAAAAASRPAAQPAAASSVFNLSAPKSPAATVPAPSNPLGSFGSASLSNADVWGGGAWGSAAAPAPSAMQQQPAMQSPTLAKSGGGGVNAFGWGTSGGSATSMAGLGGTLAGQSIVPGGGGGFGAAPKVAADEEFGGWTTTTTTAPTAQGNAAKKPAGFGGSDDLFSNVWQ